MLASITCLYLLHAWLILYFIDHWWAYHQLSLGPSSILPIVWHPLHILANSNLILIKSTLILSFLHFQCSVTVSCWSQWAVDKSTIDQGWFVPVYVTCLLAATRPEHLGHELRQRVLDFLCDLTKRDGLSVGWFYSTIYEKFGFKNTTNALGSLTLPGPTGEAYNTDRIYISEKSQKNVGWTFCAYG